MLRNFQNDLLYSNDFIITMELVPGRRPSGQSVDIVKKMAADAFTDGRIAAVTITDNPGGHPSLSPDALGHEIFSVGMDVIVHFTCRDMNRAGIESRALQLARMGIKNILALSGDYTSKGFSGKSAPVFDFDSIHLINMLKSLNSRLAESGDPDEFFTGAAISPFKYTEGEIFAQYAKLCKKKAAGAQFIFSQLGYDFKKYDELIKMTGLLDIDTPILGSIFLLSPRSARAMNTGLVPGAYVSKRLLLQVIEQWENPQRGLEMSIERSARLAAILKGLGYRGVHIGGIHRSFKTVSRIIDRMEEIEDDWKDFIDDFQVKKNKPFYAFSGCRSDNLSSVCNSKINRLSTAERWLFLSMRFFHNYFFNFSSPFSRFLKNLCEKLDNNKAKRSLTELIEMIFKKPLLDCVKCGDCGIQHLAFLCPESQCPKHLRNGACGGSYKGRCEVNHERECVWVRGYKRYASINKLDEMVKGCIPPRMWELNNTSSWLNFHRKRDHQSVSHLIFNSCENHLHSCRSDIKTENMIRLFGSLIKK